MSRRLAAMAAVLLVLVACGGDTTPDAGGGEAPPETGFATVAEGLSQIDSGRIELSLKATQANDPPRGFEMAGVFAAAASPDDLPLAELTYKNVLATATKESGFVSDGSRAWVITDRGVTELQDEKLEPLKGGGDVAGLQGLALSKWFSGEVTGRPGEPADGVETVTYSGEVDAAAALNDVLAMTASLGANVPAPLNEEGLELVRGAIQSSEATIVAGKEDNLVRRITLSIQLPPDRDDLLEALGRLYAERIEFQVNLTEVNEPVAPPAAPQGPAAPTTQPPPDFPAPPTVP